MVIERFIFFICPTENKILKLIHLDGLHNTKVIFLSDFLKNEIVIFGPAEKQINGSDATHLR